MPGIVTGILDNQQIGREVTMAVLAECPTCHKKQSVRNKKCTTCETDLDKSKGAKRVRYWISFRLPGGKQRREPVGFSIEEAKDADGKRRSQKRENRIFDMLPESKMTFQELSDWYRGLNSVKKLVSYDRVGQALNKFNDVFGQYLVTDISQVDLENYQDKRKGQGRADATVDMEIRIAQTAVIKAFDNDMLDGRALKPFRRTKKLLEKGGNARNVLVSPDQYLSLTNSASPHYRAVLVIAYNTGMRLGEIRKLQWSHIDKQGMMIRLPKDIIKEKRDKVIPINYHLKEALDTLPKALHHDFIITYLGHSMTGKFSLKKQFQETCAKAGITYGRKTPGGITFHDIRRTVKTNMAEAGVDKVYRDSILGHSLKGMDIHYIVPTDEALTLAMDRYTRWMDLKFQSVDQNVDQVASENS